MTWTWNSRYIGVLVEYWGRRGSWSPAPTVLTLSTETVCRAKASRHCSHHWTTTGYKSNNCSTYYTCSLNEFTKYTNGRGLHKFGVRFALTLTVVFARPQHIETSVTSGLSIANVWWTALKRSVWKSEGRFHFSHGRMACDLPYALIFQLLILELRGYALVAADVCYTRACNNGRNAKICNLQFATSYCAATNEPASIRKMYNCTYLPLPPTSGYSKKYV